MTDINPLKWTREHRVAWVISCAVGGLLGIQAAWYGSRLRVISDQLTSGNDPVGFFLFWLRTPHLYWPWPVMGALVVGLSFYVLKLWRSN